MIAQPILPLKSKMPERSVSTGSNTPGAKMWNTSVPGPKALKSARNRLRRVPGYAAGCCVEWRGQKNARGARSRLHELTARERAIPEVRVTMMTFEPIELLEPRERACVDSVDRYSQPSFEEIPRSRLWLRWSGIWHNEVPEFRARNRVKPSSFRNGPRSCARSALFPRTAH